MKKVMVLFFFFALCLLASDVLAQCPMCKTSLEEARKNGTQVGSTLNNGILYLLAVPYTIAIVFGYIYWRNAKLKKAAAQH
jgi:intracellular septation protein A